jgi:hypothetical protein
VPGTSEVPGTLHPVNQEQQSTDRFKKQAALVRETLRGYARERMERLARMTQEEARAIYDDLCQSWERGVQGGDLERLERWRIETLLAVRDAMARVSKGMSDEGTTP